MSHLEIRKLTKRFGQFVALHEVDLDIERGEFVVMLGPSGCGKTTLLRVIAGLERQDSGELRHAGRDISALSPGQRDYGIVFQSYALFPNLTVEKNVAYGLTNGRNTQGKAADRVKEMLALVGLPGSEKKYPAQLSGGQQQRIALARALATAPDLLLLDEPLSALDAIERVRLRAEIRSLQERLGVTTIMVTHDQEEALAIADRIVVMHQGRILQEGTPREIYLRPTTRFVADFIGRANVLEATAVDPHSARIGETVLEIQGTYGPGQALNLFVRPEEIHLADANNTGINNLDAEVLKVEFLGAFSLVTFAPKSWPVPLLAQFSSNYMRGMALHAGSRLRIGIAPEAMTITPYTA